MSQKKLIWMLVIIALAAVIVCCVRFPIPYNHTLNAAKVDAKGNTVSTVQIKIEGTKYSSVFFEDRLVAKVQEFDGGTGFLVNSEEYEQFLDEEFLNITFAVTDIGPKEYLIDATINDLDNYTPIAYRYSVSVSKDFSRWLIQVNVNNESDIYYIASVRDKYSIEELSEFFKNRIPF